MPRAKATAKVEKRHRAPAMTAEEREDQLIALANDLAERQLLEGTASAQVIAHFLKLGCTKERLEKEKLQQENELLKAKTKSIQSDENRDALYREAIESMRTYQGHSAQDEYVEDY